MQVFTMEIIPVIDLIQGQVVHARFGNRQDYQAIASQLCSSSEPIAVIEALLELYPFSTIYIADIDAILGNDADFEQIVTLAERFQNITFWVDCGIKQMNHRALHYQQNIRPVIGSENMPNLTSYKAVSYGCASRHVLSLDFKNEAALGTTELFDTAKYWPDDVICMTLNRVGSNTGADLTQIHALQQLNAARKIPSRLFAAGGVRNIADCHTLKSQGLNGVLIASALHQKQITTADLTDFYRHIL